MSERDYLWESVTKDFILDDLDEAVCALDEQGVVIVWNKKSELIYDVPKSEILGKRMDDVLPDTVIMDVLKTGVEKQNIYMATRTGCSILVKTKLIHRDGRIVGVMCVDKDLSEIDELKREVDKLYEKITYLQNEKSSISISVGNSAKMSELAKKVHKISKSDANIFVEGESGVGKKSLAKEIHTLSGRTGMFIDVNCGAVPLNLFEEEFFGVEDADQNRPGIFEVAELGTLYLEEIGEMSLKVQSKLLSVMQKGQFTRIGGKQAIPLKCRIISATTRDIYRMVEAKEFLEDLYYRLNVIALEVPPLRERGPDITLLTDAFMDELAEKYNMAVPSISPRVRNILLEYEWKGNLRELKNILEHMILMSGGKEITEEMIPYSVRNSVSKIAHSYAQVNDLAKNVADYEKSIVEGVLEHTGWNKSLAARRLNIPRTTLMYKIQQYQLERKKSKR